MDIKPYGVFVFRITQMLWYYVFMEIIIAPAFLFYRKQDSLNTERTHDFSLAGGNPNSMITHILYHLRDNKKNIIGILTCESGDLFLRFFKQYLNELVTKHLLTGAERKNVNVPDDFLINNIAGSFVEMVQWWLKNNMKHPPEKLAKYFLSVIIPII